jgi:hypothetical protein
VEDFRSQALRMLARWGEEMGRLAITGQHPLQTIRETPGDPDHRHDNGKRSARATETRSRRVPNVPIRELSGEAQRTHRIMQFVRDEDGEAYRALELVAKGVPHHQAEELLKLDRLNHRAALRAGMAIVVTILKLKAM